MHKEIENSQADSKNIIQRYFLQGLTREETKEFEKAIAYDCPDKEYGLSEKFNSKLYPFAM